MSPYFIMFGAFLITVVTMVFIYTGNQANIENRIPILILFAILMAWSMLCRIIWEIYDHRILAVYTERKKKGSESILPDEIESKIMKARLSSNNIK